MGGSLTIERGDLRSFLGLATAHLEPLYQTAYMRMCNRLAPRAAAALDGNQRKRTARNVEHHYDLPAEFYALFLDREMNYSCAYFPNGEETLEQA
jgi:cyclopropane-fatty-acyl-phospholipid synthase